LNRRVPNGTHGGGGGRRLTTASYPIKTGAAFTNAVPVCFVQERQPPAMQVEKKSLERGKRRQEKNSL